MSLARKTAILICAAIPLWAAPKLTTIQDSIYKADGTRFNGTAVISWMPFDTNDNSKIGLQSLTTQIVNGVFRVQLVPNTDATPVNYYKVQYASDGKQQFTETWAVPPSTTPLHIKDVRVMSSNASTGGGVVTPPTQNPIPESSVIGLLTDLSLRPIRGSSYTTGRTAVINDNGALDGALGNLGDCVHVDGSAGPCFDPSYIPSYIDYEIPGGSIDGTNATFTLANTPSPETSLCLYRNGLKLQAGADYNIQPDGSVLFVPAAVPQANDVLYASYRTGSDQSSYETLLPQALKAVELPKVQILCAGSGAATSNVSYTSLSSCSIPAKTLSAGDRVEIRFNYSHQGTVNGFKFQVRWGDATLVQREASARDELIAGRGDATTGSGPTNLDVQTWGTVLPLNSRVASSSAALTSDIEIDFQGAMSAAGTDSVSLQNYTVLRYAAQ